MAQNAADDPTQAVRLPVNSLNLYFGHRESVFASNFR
jgi:hypothetical protein